MTALPVSRTAPPTERTLSPLRLRDDLNALAHRAASGDERAWQLLIGRLDATLKAVTRRFALSPADRDDVAQRTWLALLRHVGRLTDHPAIAGWLATTARHECLRVLASTRREIPVDEPDLGSLPDHASPDDELLAAERRAALHRALNRVPEHEQRLMRFLLSKPDLSYDEVSSALGIPKGSIGPTRGRCVARLRDDRHLSGVVHGVPHPGHDLT